MFLQLSLQGVNIVFLNNTAGKAGAAIFASKISVCTYTNTKMCFSKEDNETDHYSRSIFKGSPFIFE